MAQENRQCGSSSGSPHQNWREIMEEFDRNQRQRDHVFKEHTLVVPEKGFSLLSDDENDVLRLVLKGIPVPEIAEMFGISCERMEECVNVIRSKIAGIEG